MHTRTTLPGYAKPDFHVTRQHEEFVWLHDRFEENEEYAGYIVKDLDLEILSKILTFLFCRFLHVHRDRISMHPVNDYSVWAKVKVT